MNLIVHGSGSSGNLYILEATTGCRLVVDMGFPFPVLKRALNFDLSSVFLMCLHCHFDHYHPKGVPDAMKAGIDVYALKETHEKMGMLGNRRAKTFGFDETFQVGEFTICSFEAKHNVPCAGILIGHDEMKPVLYLSDTAYLPNIFEDVGTYLIEANFQFEIVEDRVYGSKMNSYLGQRVLDDHLSIDECEKMLMNQDLSNTDRIVLLHLSNTNSHEVNFKNRIQRLTGRPTYIADKGLTLDISHF